MPNGTYECSSGLILPLTDESQWSNFTRVVLYLCGLLYSFLGVAIAADVFMCAIERITSTTRKIPLTYVPPDKGWVMFSSFFVSPMALVRPNKGSARGCFLI